MNSLDRKLAPEFHLIGKTPLFQPEKIILDNGIPLFVFNLQSSELIKFELIFRIQNWDKQFPLDGSAAAKLMDDGTRNKTSAQIADEIDFYGSYYQVSVQADIISIELYSLRKYLPKTLPVIFEVLTEAIFPQKEIDIFKVNNIQRIQVEEQKVQKVSSKLFFSKIFGPDSRYGFGEATLDYESLQRDRIVKAYQNCFSSENCTLLVSGLISPHEISVIGEVFGNQNWGVKSVNSSFDSFSKVVESHEKYTFQEIEGAQQSALKIGKPFIKKNHPDFPALQVLNTILGGYFGSRLMSNIREDKGYTYGIGSSVNAFRGAGFFYITTEVKAESTQAAIKEIIKEINRLKEVSVPEAELDLVKNFLRGSFLSSLENAFSYADKFKSIYFQDIDYTYYDRVFETLDQINSKDLMDLANQYWDLESLHTVVVGKE